VRILHFYKNALPESVGGVEQVIDQISRGTELLGVQNTVLALSNSPSKKKITINGYDLITAHRDFEFASNGFSWQLISIFKDLADKVDLIHYHFPWPTADIIHTLIRPRRPTILTYHSDIIRQKILLPIYSPLMRHFLKSVSHIVATSPNYLKTSHTLQNFLDKTSVIPIGLNSQSYPNPDPSLIRLFKSRFGDRFFLFVGAFRYYKGLNYLIEAAKTLTYPIVIAGKGPLENQLKLIVSQLRLKNIYFVGQVTEGVKSALLESCFCVVFPSHLRSEAFGVTLLEGAMYGKPLISCEIGTGTSFINIDRETGLVIPPANSKALSRAMEWLWNNNKLGLEMGNRARLRYEKLFTADQMVISYHELYQKMVNK
jgi:glycosyltransferase involved in cell wall biosynthesis